MNYKKKSIRDASFKDKKVLLRVDFNLPLDKKTHAITNDKRIRAALPTIRYLLDEGAALVVSGIIEGRQQEVLEALEANGFTVDGKYCQEEWYCFRCH